MKRKTKNENDKAEQIQSDIQTENPIEKKSETSEQNDGEFIPDGELISEKSSPQKNIIDENSDSANTDFMDINSLINKYSSEHDPDPNTDIDQGKKLRKKRTTKNKETEKPAMIIPGKLFVLVNDRVITGLISAIDSWVSKDPVDSTMLQLQSEQLEDLAPLAESAMKEMNLQDNPIAMFYGTLGAIYISNYMAIKALILKTKKQNHENI